MPTGYENKTTVHDVKKTSLPAFVKGESEECFPEMYSFIVAEERCTEKVNLSNIIAAGKDAWRWKHVEMAGDVGWLSANGTEYYTLILVIPAAELSFFRCFKLLITSVFLLPKSFMLYHTRLY